MPVVLSRSTENKEEVMELFGILSIILGIIGMIVMLKGKRPQDPSSDDPVKMS